VGTKSLISATFLAGLCLAGPAFAAVDPTGQMPDPAAMAHAQALKDACSKFDCRQCVRTLYLRMPDGKRLEASTDRYPYVDDKGTIIIYPDETIAVVSTGQGEKLGPPALVSVIGPDGPVALRAAPKQPANLTFAFKEFEAGKSGMLLDVTNQIDAALEYDATMVVWAGSGFRFVHTSVCRLMPPQLGQANFHWFENWPHPVVMLIISNIHGLPKNSPQRCQ